MLDLRYNGGGSVDSASHLASMLTGQFEGNVLYKTLYNQNLQGNLQASINFPTVLEDQTTITSLGLSRLFVLTSSVTASASELLINSLEPYIDVVQIGQTTRGKYQGSITVYDSESGGLVNVNPSHTYAVQPLILKIANALNVTDYKDGLAPDYEMEEELATMGALATPTDSFFAKVLEVLGASESIQEQDTPQDTRLEEVAASSLQSIIITPKTIHNPIHHKVYTNSITTNPLYGNMYVNSLEKLE